MCTDSWGTYEKGARTGQEKEGQFLQEIGCGGKTTGGLVSETWHVLLPFKET